MAKSFEKLKTATANTLFNRLQELGNQAPKISHALNVLHNHAVNADQKFSIAANTRKTHHLSDFFRLPKHLLKYTTFRIPCCIHILEIFILNSPTPYSPLLKSLTTFIIHVSSSLNSECNRYLQIWTCWSCNPSIPKTSY